MSTARTSTGTAGIGAFAGTVTYLFGYLVTHLWQAANVRESLDAYNFVVELFGGTGIPIWKAVGWLFYNAHFVPFTYPEDGGRASANFIAGGDAPALLYLLPPILLAVAGFVLARAANARSADTGLRAGAGVVIGYLVFTVLGVFLFQHGSGAESIHPHYALAPLLAGIVYPVVFGGIGGALGGVTTSS
ncbi:transporter [Halobacterium zhouii]|uniref:transporter n=1 Tax=Halobacterium zhouii TaxID=2902624 RepID=UPI001E6595B9|nr:transporter [Halobacterium zhouii]